VLSAPVVKVADKALVFTDIVGGMYPLPVTGKDRLDWVWLLLEIVTLPL